MLLSKRPEMFLPNLWPAYYSKSKGCKVWDLEGNCYYDVSIMGIGTNILGYGHNEVDNSVIQTVKNGNMSSLNCREEVDLAEKLLQLNPWADMVRFARTGGEANAIAVRIARAAAGKNEIAVCGYHGWHDWYLSANLNKKDKLKNHLLPGLKTAGVPPELEGTIHTFNYNDYEGLEKLISEKDIGVVKMEVMRTVEPESKFLKKIRALTKAKGIVLIFDECTSGFRATKSGLHEKYNVEPDVSVYGKALGNGYAITAIVGREPIMRIAEETFISSTFWSERIGPAAGLKTLEVMGREQSWLKVSNTGQTIKDTWKTIANNHGLQIKIFGIDALPVFVFNNDNHLKYKTFITQEMLARGFIASNTVYVCIDHSRKILDEYFNTLNNIFKVIADCENGKSIDKLLKGPVCHDSFKRLN